MVWYQHRRDINYYTRLSLINKIKKHVAANYEYNTPIELNPPVVFTYNGGKKTIVHLENHHYMSQFKKMFTNIRALISDGTYVPIQKLRLKHLLPIVKKLGI